MVENSISEKMLLPEAQFLAVAGFRCRRKGVSVRLYPSPASSLLSGGIRLYARVRSGTVPFPFARRAWVYGVYLYWLTV